MATVYLGWLEGDQGVVRPVAIKMMHPTPLPDARSVSRFLGEARIASRIRHPNVVPVLDVVSPSGTPVLVLEYVSGESLALALETGEDIPASVIVRILVDCLEGLHAAHEVKNEAGLPLDVVHRDVSPQNILIEECGLARILDFGIAKALERTVTTESGEVRGKIAYVAPEQLSGGDVDRRADVWAVGMVMRELLTREKPFAGLETFQAVQQLLAGDLAPLRPTRPFSPSVIAICQRALSPDPGERFATAREMALALEQEEVAPHRDVAKWLRLAARPSLERKSATLKEMERLALRERKETAPTNEVSEETDESAKEAMLPQQPAKLLTEQPAKEPSERPTAEPASATIATRPPRSVVLALGVAAALIAVLSFVAGAYWQRSLTP